MSDPAEFPLPAVLDADAVDTPAEALSAEERYERSDRARRAAVEYGRQLWQQVDELRRYLLNCVPAHADDVARPAGPDDEPGWAAWQRAYAGATSVLAGPRGDNGFGGQEADREARARRAHPDDQVQSVRNRPSVP